VTGVGRVGFAPPRPFRDKASGANHEPELRSSSGKDCTPRVSSAAHAFCTHWQSWIPLVPITLSPKERWRQSNLTKRCFGTSQPRAEKATIWEGVHLDYGTKLLSNDVTGQLGGYWGRGHLGSISKEFKNLQEWENVKPMRHSLLQGCRMYSYTVSSGH
jgi:hypothetical protein